MVVGVGVLDEFRDAPPKDKADLLMTGTCCH